MDGRWNWLMIDVNGISASHRHRHVCTHIQMIAVLRCLIPALMKLTVMIMMIALCD